MLGASTWRRRYADASHWRCTVLDVSGRAAWRALRDVDLDRFLHPRTVAVIGASDAPRKPNTAMTRKLKAWADAHGATFYPVHPTTRRSSASAATQRVFDVPGDIDLAVILTGKRRRHVRGGRAAQGGVRGDLRRRLRRGRRRGRSARGSGSTTSSRGGDTHLLGPNTNLNAFEDFRDDLAGPAIALITQSGHQGRPVFQGQELGIRLSHWAPTGNEVDLEFADFARYFADQPEVGVIAAYIEGFKDGRTLHARRRPRRPGAASRSWS